jgi:acetyltransferase
MSEDRKKRASSLDWLFNPASVAIIGASASMDKPSGGPLIALLNSGYQGKIFPVNPRYPELYGVTCYPSVTAVPGRVDMAVIAVPSAYVLETLEECVKKEVKAAVVISSGFAEVDAEGAKLQDEMVEIARRSGMSICGPNTMGIISNPANLNVNFAIIDLPETISIPNFLGFVTQSGGFGFGVFEMIRSFGIGFSHLIGSGNEADIDFSDYLAYLANDENTQVIGGYLEGIRKGVKFKEAVEMALHKGKPVVLIKTGRTDVAAKAAASHTGSLTGSDRVYQAVFRQKGVIRVESFHEMLATLQVLLSGKLPEGNRVGVVSSSGGAGVYLADKCIENGLVMAELAAETCRKLEQLLPAYVSVNNPVDITAVVMENPSLFFDCCKLLADDPGVDILFTVKRSDSQTMLAQEEKITDLARGTPKPVINLLWGHQESAHFIVKYFTERMVPMIYEIEYGVKAAASLAEYNRKKKGLKKEAKAPETTPAETLQTVAGILDRFARGSVLTEHDAKSVLSAYGIPVTNEELAQSAQEAVAAAGIIGYPVALKIQSPQIPHKTEAGGVQLNLQTRADVEAAFQQIMSNARQFNPLAEIEGVLVQEMVPAGVDLIAGISRDPVFGPTVIFGLGGIFVEVLQDVSLRVPPLTREDALEMTEEIKGGRILDGFRGLPAVNREDLAVIILKLSRLALDFPRIIELDINPLVCSAGGIKAADALIVLE